MERPRSNGHQRYVRALVTAAAALSACALNSSPANAQGDDASAVVKRMTDYLAAHPDLSSQYDIEFDVITPEIEKLQFAASGAMTRSAPNRVHLTRHGGYSDVELLSLEIRSERCP